MKETNKHKGPWLHRLGIGVLTVALTLLAFWLLDFVMNDIGTLRGPQLADSEKKFLSQSLLDEAKGVDRQITDVGRQISDQNERQQLLRDSTSGFQRTMNQPLGMQRASLTEAQQKVLSDSVVLFLANQKHDQDLTEDIVKLSEKRRTLQAEKRALDERLEARREVARNDWNGLCRRHELKLACLKLLVLLPLLSVAVWFFLKKRGALYAPLIYATGGAVLWQTGLVIHQYFPTRHFKYIILSAAIGIVIYLLALLLRMIRFPKASVLLKQYRESYEHFFCPICEYPIRRGPMRFLAWTRRSVRKLIPAATETDMPYTCPFCGTALYERCAKCQEVRHSLLPHCEHCGAEKTITGA
jgi:predicted RNA-binding Zn-ribbon protein involved in translation (DUF1610 family)